VSMSTLSLALIFFCVVTIVVGIYKIHSLPGDIARKRGHPQTDAITICSILGLMVFPFWMFALVWAYAGVLGTPYEIPGPAAQAGSGSPEATAGPDADDASASGEQEA